MDITSPVATTPAPAASSTPININSTPSSAPLPPKASTSLPDESISLDFENEPMEIDVNDLVKRSNPTKAEKSEVDEKEPEDTTPENTEEDPFDLPKDVAEALKSNDKKPVEKPVEKTTETPQTQQGRDYNNLPDEVVSVLKKLPNQTYNAVRNELPKWYEAFKAQKEIPKYYTQHPEAYRLDPAYNQTQNEVETDRFETGTLKEALVSAKSGKPFELLTGYDKDGAPVFQTVSPKNGRHDPSIEIELTEAYRRAQANLDKSLTSFKNFPERYKQKLSEERAFIDSSFKKIFKDIDPEKFTPEEGKYSELLQKIIPDSVTAEDARKIAHYAMVGNLRMAKAFQAYIDKTKSGPVRPAPSKGALGRSVGGDDIPLKEAAMFGEED